MCSLCVRRVPPQQPVALMSVETGLPELTQDLDGNQITLSSLSKVLDALNSGNMDEGEVEHVEVELDILQPGSHSGVLALRLGDGAAFSVRRIFLKKITCNHAPMAKRAWSPLLHTCIVCLTACSALRRTA